MSTFKSKKRKSVLFILLQVFLSLAMIFAYGQTARKINGTVTDDQGKPLARVSVTIKGTNRGTTTNDAGTFTISVNPTDKTIVIGSVGFATREVAISESNQLNIKLQASSAEGAEDVVIIGYGTVKKRDVTGSVGTVKMDEFNKATGITSFEGALAGRIAGVQVTSPDGQPGSSGDIVVRGVGTLSGSAAPLYIIDGFPQESGNNNTVNPNDIESIEVLKDASATAIYGSRGANGVVIITTKRGKTPKPTINYNGYYGTQQKLKKIELMDSYEFVKLQTEINPTFAAQTYFQNGKTLDSYKDLPAFDWVDALFRDAPFNSHSISASGRSGKTSYFISGNYLDQKGLLVNSGFYRYQGRISLDQEVSDKLKIGLTANYGYVNSYGNITSAQTQGLSGTTGTQSNNQFNLMFGAWSWRPLTGAGNADTLKNSIGDDAGVNSDLDRINPLVSNANEINNRANDNLVANAYVEIRPIKDLVIRSTVGYNFNNTYQEIFHNSMTRGGSPTTAQGIASGVNGSVINTSVKSFLNENTLSYNRNFNSNNALNVVVGVTEQIQNVSSNSFSDLLVPNESLGISGLDEGTPYQTSIVKSKNALVSFLGRVNYNWYQKYLFTVSFRSDASSKFADGHQWGYFPSGAFAWRFTNESFFNGLKKVISDGKFRISYGATGNNRVSDYPYQAGITTSSTSASNRYSFNNTTGIGSVPNAIYNPSLTWEVAKTFDAGLDISFLNNNINLTVDYYKKITDRLLLNAAIPYTTGFSTANQNIGKISNEGLEFSLNTTNVRTKNFTWSTNFNISFNRNRLLALSINEAARLTTVGFSAELTNAPYIAKIGQPIAQFYGYINNGLYQLADFDKTPNGAAPNYNYILKDNVPYFGSTKAGDHPGDVKFKDLNGDGIIDTKDLTVIGNPYPIHFGGISNDFRYKAFDLNIFLQWSYGNQVYNGNKISMEANSTGDDRGLGLNKFASYEDRWSFDNQNGKYQSARATAFGVRAFKSNDVEDGSFLRLKTVSLGYNIPPRILSKVFITSARIYIAGQNLATLTSYKGLDPEVNAYPSLLTPGFDYSPYPRARVISVGANVNF